MSLEAGPGGPRPGSLLLGALVVVGTLSAKEEEEDSGELVRLLE